MWKLAQRSLLNGKSCRSIHRCRLERTCYLSTTKKTTTTIRDQGINEKSQHRHQNTTTSTRHVKQQPNFCSRRNAGEIEKLLESAKGFLANSENSSSWTREHLELANGILRTWSSQTIPKELHPHWIPIVDQLMRSTLDQYKIMCKSSEESNQQLSNLLVPDSNVFNSIITMYSKSKLPNAAERADYWLQEMVDASKLHPERVTAPRASIFTNVLSAWEKSRLSDSELRAEILWKQLKSTKGLSPTSSAYYLYISLWSKSCLPSAALMADNTLRELVEKGRRNPTLIPSAPTFVNVISSWRRKGSIKRAQSVLDLLISEYVRRSKLPQQWMHIPINDIPFNATIQTIATSREIPTHEAEERIDAIYKCMKKLDVSPTMVTAWSTLPMYAHLDENSVDDTNTPTTAAIKDVPVKILRMLDLTMSQHGGGKNPMLQNQIYSKALEICSSTNNINSSKNSRASSEIVEEILLNRYLKRPRMERRIETTIDGFEYAIKAWVHDNNHCAVDKENRIIRLLEKMENEFDSIYMRKHKHDPSICRLFSSLAKAWAMSSYPFNALQRAEDNVERLLLCCKEHPDFVPCISWFQDIIKAAEDNFSERDATEFVEKLYTQILANESQFHRMIEHIKVQPDSDSSVEGFFNGVLDNLVSSSVVNSGRRAEIILLKQQELYDEGACSPPTFDTFNKVLNCWSNSQEEGAVERMENMLLLAQSLYDDGDTNLRPDFDGYMTVITAWSKSQRPDAPDRIQMHLKSLQKRRLEGDQTFTIDSRIYAALIRAYANSDREDAQTMANTIFESAPDNLRNTSIYNALIEAQGGNSSRAEELLQIMHLLYYEGHDIVKPNTKTFNAVIQSWLRSGSSMAAWRADNIFKQMQDLSKSGKLDVKPNSRTFDLVISTLAQEWGTELAKVDKYLALLKERYLAGDCVPTVTSYTEAIRAWTKDDDPRAFLRAQALLDEMHELAREGVHSVRPNRSTYEVYLDGLKHSSVEDRTQLVNDVLLKMRQNDIDLDNDMRSCIQRCLLPLSSRSNTWIVNVDEYINTQNDWKHTSSI